MSSGQANNSLYLIDAHALIFQVFHAIPPMASPSGLPTNAVFGFTRDLLYLRNEIKPGYLICVFDARGPTFRDEIYPEYKANRGPMPDDLQLQIPEIHDLLGAMRIPVLAIPGFEADDTIATLARAGAQRGLEVLICTSDKDARQLIDDRIRIYNLRKNEFLDREGLLKDWGVRPDQVVDLQTLVGDSVDNVPGVPGIGLKTGAKLLQEFDTLDNILAHVDRVPGAKKQESLRASLPFIERGRTLVRLVDNVPLELNWSEWQLQEWDAPRLQVLFRQWGFHRFADQVRQASIPAQQMLPFADNGNVSTDPVASVSDTEPEAQWQADYHLVNTSQGFRSFVKELGRQKRFAVDLETTGLEPRRAEIVGFAFCWKSGEAWYLPVRGPAGEAVLTLNATLNELRPILEDRAIAKINQNIKYDMLVMRQHGIVLAGVAGDPMVADYLLHAGERNHNMEVLSRHYLRHEAIPITDLIGKKGKNQLRMDEVPTIKVAEYSGEDADVAYRLCAVLEPELKHTAGRSPGILKTLYDELEVPLIEVLAELEFNGIRLDVSRLRRLSEAMAQELEAVEREIYDLAGHPFNIASLKQLRQVLFDELRLPVQRKTGITGEASTDQETLERLAALGHELPKKILAQRQISKLKSTYVDALPQLVNPQTNRVHASFNQTVAATGRLSGSDPNLQNIPIRTEQGGQIRQAFLPEPGWTLVTADYSQIELRLLAHFCGDPALGRAFAVNRDIHASVAAQIFRVAENEVDSNMRRMAKVVNFGVIYGISAFGLSARLGIPKEEAAAFIDAYFARYPLVLQYQTELLENCRTNGYVSTILGRRRAISGIRERTTYQQRNQPEREAINMEIQGSAADLIKVAMLNIHRRLKRENRQSRMLLQIHDELVFEVPPNEMTNILALIEEEMTQALAEQLTVPLKVDMAAGPNWLDVEELESERVRE